MKRSSLLQNLSVIVFFAGMIFLFQNCNVLSRPQAVDMSSLSLLLFHDNFDVATLQCMDCHESDRKDVAHFAGQDCAGCHVPGPGWAVSADAAHNPVPVQCKSCHADGATYDRYPVGHMAIASGSDCIDCHKASISAGFMDWKGGLFAHDATLIAGRNCSSCHAADRPPIVNSTNINPSINDARVVDKTHFAAKDCFYCHNAPPTGNSWRGASANQYEHTDASGIKLNFCLSCHMRSEHVGVHGSVNSDLDTDGKCQQCHQKRRSWDKSPRNPNL
ncbi:MAG: hypothetical protein AB7N80_05660 [Bdellovibrionales bacterium]